MSGKWSLWTSRRSAARRVRILPPISKRLTRSGMYLRKRPTRNGAATPPVIFRSTCPEAAAKPAKATARSPWRCSFWRTSNSSAKSGVLEVRYHGKNVHEVLQLTVREALAFFVNVPKIVSKLRVLNEIGLGYLRLGQSATTLSGGEAQRLKLAAHLSQTDNEGILYILDEPTTGLHFDDIAKLLSAFRKLLEGGASLLVIEHNLDVIKSADWLIDLGPEGGDQGGKIIATGTPEQVARNTQSHTGRYLARVLNGNGQAKRPANGASKPVGPSATISNGAKTSPAEP